MVFVILVILAVIVAIGVSKARGKRVHAEKQLARMLSPDAAERLIDYEMKREPGLTRSKAAARALDRAMYDRGR